MNARFSTLLLEEEELHQCKHYISLNFKANTSRTKNDNS